MKKIGFLVQEDFLTVHYGVRNYFSAIAETCAEADEVDYLVHRCHGEGVDWFACTISVTEQESGCAPCMAFDVERDANFIKLGNVQRFIGENNVGRKVPRGYLRCIGRDLEVENYDLLVITNPWLVDFDGRLPAKKVVGIVHDLVSNLYALSKPTFDFTFSFQHNRGYQYYAKYCDVVLMNSEATERTYLEHYTAAQTRVFPPFPPRAFKDAVYAGEPKENAMLLAAPFDPRKGIESMPVLINGAADRIDTLYIYGMPRCPGDMFDDFFKALRVGQIRYYPYVGDRELIKLYARCRVMLFPSIDEGLGLPLMEAQICGCPVVTTDRPPMNRLARPGSVLLTDDAETDIAAIRTLLAGEDFDYGALSRDAREAFSFRRLAAFMGELTE